MVSQHCFCNKQIQSEVSQKIKKDGPDHKTREMKQINFTKKKIREIKLINFISQVFGGKQLENSCPDSDLRKKLSLAV